jgi:hypothetical protein
MAVRLPTLRAGCPLPPGRFLELIYVKRLHRPQGHSAAGRIRSIEKSSGMGSRTHDLPSCSIVPQPTMLLHAPSKKMDFREVGLSGVDWINLSRDRDQWRAIANTVMNFRVPCYVGKFFVAELLAASQEGLNSLELVSSHPSTSREVISCNALFFGL